MSSSPVRSKFASDVERISFPDARTAMLARTKPLPTEIVSLLEANGRVVAETYRASEDIVPFARSAMDGYALRASDTDGATEAVPTTLPVLGASYAGDAPSALLPGSASAITTGAMLPSGADAVVPFEDIDRIGDTIVIREPLAPRDHVFEPGDDAKGGEALVPAGTVLTPGGAALLASAGVSRVAVHRRPRVAIVSTGNEVVGLDQTPALGQIRNSNATMLAACLAADGAVVVSSEHAQDDEQALRTTLERALQGTDLVITTGGASTGERDFVKRACRTLGADFAFDSIALRPAKPTGFASVGATLVAVFPGNPAAAYVAYVSLLRGVIRRLSGHAEAYESLISATLYGTIRRKERRHFLMFASLKFYDGVLHAQPLENQCSSLVRTSAEANALIVADPGNGFLTTGQAVPVIVVDNSRLFKSPVSPK